MSVKIGISPIAWQNDDLPELTADYTMDQALEEAREIGFTGVERGRRMPQETKALRAYLGKYDLALCGGWCSGNLLVNDVAAEKQAVRQQVEQFAALALDVGDRAYVMRRGGMVYDGDCKTLLDAPDKLHDFYLGSASAEG